MKVYKNTDPNLYLKGTSSTQSVNIIIKYTDTSIDISLNISI